MKGYHTYSIYLNGQIDTEDLNQSSPMHLTASSIGITGTRVLVITDQSGLIGLLRHLHHRGVVILSFSKEEN